VLIGPPLTVYCKQKGTILLHVVLSQENIAGDVMRAAWDKAYYTYHSNGIHCAMPGHLLLGDPASTH